MNYKTGYLSSESPMSINNLTKQFRELANEFNFTMSYYLVSFLIVGRVLGYFYYETTSWAFLDWKYSLARMSKIEKNINILQAFSILLETLQSRFAIVIHYFEFPRFTLADMSSIWWILFKWIAEADEVICYQNW